MRLSSAIPLFLCSALLLWAPCAGAQVTITNEKAALTGERDPFNGLIPGFLKVFRLGPDGAAIFGQEGPSTSRAYLATYAGVVTRLAGGARATGNVPVSDFLVTGGNDAGQFAVTAYDGVGHRNIYLLTGLTLKTIVAEGANLPGDEASYFLYDPAMDEAGHMAFKAETFVSGQGIYYADAAATPPALKKIVVLGNSAPEGGTFTYLDHRISIVTRRADGKVIVFFNASTTVEGTEGAEATDSSGFYAAVVGGAGPAVLVRIADGLHTEYAVNRAGEVVYRDFNKIYRGDLNGSTVIATVDDAAPGGGIFAGFGEAAISDSGTVVFQAWTDFFSGAGLYVSTADGITAVARRDQVVDDETLQDFGVPQINEHGLIAFSADVVRGNVASSSIYLSDGTALARVTGNGEPLAGSFIQPTGTFGSLVFGPNSLNVHGQIAFAAKLANEKEGIFIATPTSRLREGGPGLWDDPLTWNFRIVPGPDTPVVAASAGDAVLQGPPAPVARKVRSVQVGGGTGTTTLHLQTGSTLTLPKGATLLDHGTLSGSGTIAGNLSMGPGSRLHLELAGATRAAYDFLRVTGTATLGGTLVVTKSANFEPTRGQTFDVLDLTRRVGTFAATSLPPLNPAGQTWDLPKLYTAGWITVSGATLFAPAAGVFTGTFDGNPTASTTSGSVLLTVAPNGRLSGSIVYGGRRYYVNTILNVDGSATVTFGLPKKTLQVQVATVNGAPQMTAAVSTGGVQESLATSARANPAFPVNSPFVGRYTIALPPDPAHVGESTFPQGTGYAKVNVTTRGLASVVGVLGDGTAFSAGGPLTASGEFPFYMPAYALKGVVSGKLVLHGSTPADSVEGSIRWLKPAVTTGKFKSAIDATVTAFGSGFRNPVAPAKILTFPNDQATFHATGASVDPLPDKLVKFATAYQLKSTTAEPFVLTFAAGTYGLGSGNFRDAGNKVRTMKGVALQKQNAVIGLLIGTDQTGTFDID